MKELEAQRLTKNLGLLVNAFREVNNAWPIVDAELGKKSYPFQNDFETQLRQVEEWVEEFTENIEEATESDEVPVTYALIKRKVGWSRFAEVTGRNPNVVNDVTDYYDQEVFWVTEQQAYELGFI